MPVRSTFSQRSSLEAIQASLALLAKDTTMNDVVSELKDTIEELRTLRTGFEIFQWEEEVEDIK